MRTLDDNALVGAGRSRTAAALWEQRRPPRIAMAYIYELARLHLTRRLPRASFLHRRDALT